MAKIEDLKYRYYRTGYGTREEERAYMNYYNNLSEDKQYIENLEVERRVILNKLVIIEDAMTDIQDALEEIYTEENK